MSRILAISDIHGCYDELIQLLNKVKYNPQKDKLILLGDYIDRGKDSRKVIELVMDLVNNGAVALKGNHEDMLIKALDDIGYCQLWLQNGGKKTLRSYHISGGYGSIPWYEQPNKIPRQHIEFIKNLPTWHETEDYIFVHAGLPSYANCPEESNDYDLMWIRNEWFARNWNGKVVVFGHTPTFTIEGHERVDIWLGNRKVCIDTGCVFKKYGGKLSCLQLPSMVWQV